MHIDKELFRRDPNKALDEARRRMNSHHVELNNAVAMIERVRGERFTHNLIAQILEEEVENARFKQVQD